MERRLPAYPLFVKDPYFSLWANAEYLYEKDVIFWTGAEKRLVGYLKVGGTLYRFLGAGKGKTAEQRSLAVTAFTTDYLFYAEGVTLKLSFVSPLLPDDLSVMSCPVCYVNYELSGEAEVIFAAEEGLCYNGDGPRAVRGAVVREERFETAFFGLKRQLPLSDDSDRDGAEWGYWYLTGERAYFLDETAFASLLRTGEAPAGPYRAGRAWIVSVSAAQRGRVMLGFDDTVSIQYFGEMLKGYYLSDHTIFDALRETFARADELDRRLQRFHSELMQDAAEYGEAYQNVLIASLRQSIGAHKLVKDRCGEVLFLSKECYSNGCIGTVDISYPASPLYLLYNPALIRGMLRPVFRFAKMPVWKYDFAPHDVGTYPHCCGQVYGMREDALPAYGNLFDGGEGQTRYPFWQLPASAEIYRDESQMPVEESANVLILLAAAAACDGDTRMAEQEFPLLVRWAEYLSEHGLKPENQLCTDDFSGHLKNNLNLAIKAAVGLACFAKLCAMLGRRAAAEKYRKTAERFAAEISAFAAQHPHMPLTWDSGAETYSLKYNLAFDRVLRLGLFDEALLEREVACYTARANRYGVPLDPRAGFTKSDWMVWSACLTSSTQTRKLLVGTIDRYLRESSDRLPFGDWYETETGALIGFRNRAVQGGCFMLLLDRKFNDIKEGVSKI